MESNLKEKKTIKISSVIKDIYGELYESTTLEKGVYSFKDNRHLIVYEESGHEKNKKVLVSLEVIKKENDDLELGLDEVKLILRKTGFIENKMIFDVKEGKLNSQYKNNYGTIDMEVDTKILKVEMSDEVLEILIEYDLYMNKERVSENSLKIEVDI